MLHVQSSDFANFEESTSCRAFYGQFFETSDLPAYLIAAISSSTMAPEHDGLNALLDDA